VEHSKDANGNTPMSGKLNNIVFSRLIRVVALLASKFYLHAANMNLGGTTSMIARPYL